MFAMTQSSGLPKPGWLAGSGVSLTKSRGDGDDEPGADCLRRGTSYRRNAAMRIHRWLAIALTASLIAGATVAAAQVGGKVASGGSDGLVQVKSRWFDEVYLRPGADFRGYTKVIVDA